MVHFLVYTSVLDTFKIVSEDELAKINNVTERWLKLPMNPLEFYVMKIKDKHKFEVLLVKPEEYYRSVDFYIVNGHYDPDQMIVEKRKIHLSKFDVTEEKLCTDEDVELSHALSLYHFYHL
jgi:hypothetical protein